VSQRIKFGNRQEGLDPFWGGLQALVVPLIVVLLALGQGFNSSGTFGDPTTSELGALIFLVAVPTSWVFAIDFIEASRLTVVVVGLATSLPLWWWLGSRIARQAPTWAVFWLRFVVAMLAWTSLFMVAFATIGSVFA
jgi:hypothetical protein